MPTLGETITRALIEQMDGTRFPVEFDTLLSDRRVIFDDPRPVLTDLGLHTDIIPLNHPGGGFGYRVANDGRTIVYLTDNELEPPGDIEAILVSSYVQFCQGADGPSTAGATASCTRRCNWRWQPAPSTWCCSTTTPTAATTTWTPSRPRLVHGCKRRRPPSAALLLSRG